MGHHMSKDNDIYEYQDICSAQSENLCNLKIVLRILRIPRLGTIVAQSRDCAIHLRYLKIA